MKILTGDMVGYKWALRVCRLDVWLRPGMVPDRPVKAVLIGTDTENHTALHCLIKNSRHGVAANCPIRRLKCN